MCGESGVSCRERGEGWKRGGALSGEDCVFREERKFSERAMRVRVGSEEVSVYKSNENSGHDVLAGSQMME
jgi:hypothetical protein